MSDNKELAENKLLLLYIIHRINMPVSNLQITRIILESKYMNYFMLQQILNELINDKLLTCSNEEDKTFYTITKDGKQLLGYFPHLIPTGIKARIDSAIPAIKKNIKNETQITAHIEPEGMSGFSVVCRINDDNFTLLDLKLTVGTREEALTLCEHWEKHNQAIYNEIVESLIKKRE